MSNLAVRFCFILLAAAALLQLGLVSLPGGSLRGAEPADQKLLQGSWRSYEVQQGKKKSQPDSKNATGMTFTFSENEVTHHERDTLIFSGTFRLQPQAKPPQIDVTVGKGGEYRPGVVLPGIYQLEGDRLILCFGEPSEKQGVRRRKDFSAQETRDITIRLRKAAQE